MVQWDEISKADADTIDKIVDRASCFGLKRMFRLNLTMDISAAHLDCPMDLARLLAFPSADFIHDVGGINDNIDRETGKLTECFFPRCAVTT